MIFEVLIVDDDDAIVYINKKLVELSKLHSRPLSFGNGKQALDYLVLDKNADKIYFILLDINMPVMNGWKFLEAIDQYPFAKQVFVAVVTSSIDESDRQKAYQYSHVIDYIEKPVEIDRLNELKLLKELKPFFN
jgi:CheY-like chemotaxis protein